MLVVDEADKVGTYIHFLPPPYLVYCFIIKPDIIACMHVLIIQSQYYHTNFSPPTSAVTTMYDVI